MAEHTDTQADVRQEGDIYFPERTEKILRQVSEDSLKTGKEIQLELYPGFQGLLGCYAEINIPPITIATGLF